MGEPANQPGPGRSTSEAALNALKKQIAERNDQVQKEALRLRAERERAETKKRRALDLL
jgi:hypothetical protein